MLQKFHLQNESNEPVYSTLIILPREEGGDSCREHFPSRALPATVPKNSSLHLPAREESSAALVSTKQQTQIYDGAARLWRTVVVDSVVVRWVDLGTKLVLRHVVRVLEAEKEEQANNRDQTEGDGREEKRGDREREGRDGSSARGKSDSGKGATGAATAEVDLDEVRWAECTGRAKERKPSRSTAKKLAGG